jgi:hypothetical protein
VSAFEKKYRGVWPNKRSEELTPQIHTSTSAKIKSEELGNFYSAPNLVLTIELQKTDRDAIRRYVCNTTDCRNTKSIQYFDLENCPNTIVLVF